MSIQVRYLLGGRCLAGLPAQTMFEARRLANKAARIDADTVAIFGVDADGKEVEIETRWIGRPISRLTEQK